MANLRTKSKQEKVSPITKLVCDMLSLYENYRSNPVTMQGFADTFDILHECGDCFEDFDVYAVSDHMWDLKRNSSN